MSNEEKRIELLEEGLRTIYWEALTLVDDLPILSKTEIQSRLINIATNAISARNDNKE